MLVAVESRQSWNLGPSPPLMVCSAPFFPSRFWSAGDRHVPRRGFDLPLLMLKQWITRRHKCYTATAMASISPLVNTPPVTGTDPSQLRSAIRETRMIAVACADEKGRPAERTIGPLEMAYH
jgi:hypothetical protein